MQTIKIKPLSVNEAWQGRRFKTEKYKQYEKDLSLLLKPIKILNPKRIMIEVEFGVSALSDIDNPIKPMLDILQKKYKFNDRDVFYLIVKKRIVKKGYEFIELDIT